MASFIPTKKTADDFNNGIQYVGYDANNGTVGDILQAETINNLIESQLWTQSLADNQPNVSDANNFGDVSVSIDNTNGTPRLKFSNLKGQQGEQGAKGEKGEQGNGIQSNTISYATSTSGTNIPTSWQTTIPNVEQGHYLWTRIVFTYTDGTNSEASYIVTYQGMNGEGFNTNGTYPNVTVGNATNAIIADKVLNFPCPAVGMHHIQFSGEPTPAEIWAGTTWVIDTKYNGQTIVGSGGQLIIGAEGGNPTHSHTLSDKTLAALYINGSTMDYKYISSSVSPYSYTSNYKNTIPSGVNSSASISHPASGVAVLGDTNTASSMQPFVVVNIWKRMYDE